ncbi:MAG: ABC transporter substrate-binding protein [Nocardioides sp.]|uniref:ABC transporter substrate-binding protein n=1 Tax=Nocardioides sp. TaxID=35761 RepID=UPI0039E5C6C8
MNDRLSRRAFMAAGAATLAAASLAACGSSSSSSTTSDGLTKVTVLRSTGGTFEGLYITQQQGYFEDAGLDVTIKAGASDTSQNVPSVLKGEAQFAMTDIGGLVKAVAQGLGVKAVSQIQASSSSIAQSDGLLVAKGSSITSPAQLVGKKVALPVLSGNLQMMAMTSVKESGGDPTKVNWVALPTTSLLDSLQKGQVAAIDTFSSYYAAALAAGAKSIDKGSQVLLGDPQALIFSSDDYLSDNASVAKKFVSALQKGFTYANAHPDAVRAVDSKYTEMDAKTIKNEVIQAYDAKFDESAVTQAADNFYEFDLIDTKVSVSDLLWSGAPTTS